MTYESREEKRAIYLQRNREKEMRDRSEAKSYIVEVRLEVV